MNFAILNKVHLVSGAADELIKQLKKATQQARLKNIAEIIFYRSPANVNEFYVVSFWYELQLNQLTEPAARDFFNHLEDKGELLEREVFRLAWEYRQLSQMPATSQLRLMRFPQDFPEEKARQIINHPRQHRLEVPGIIGMWAGYSLENPKRSLHRVDWASLQDRLNFFNSPETEETIAQRRAWNIDIKYASFDFQELIEHSPETIPNNQT